MTTPSSAPPNPRQAFGLAAGAVLAEINHHPHDTLGVDRAMLDTVLRRDWGIQNRAELLDMLEWLAAGGHRKELAGQIPAGGPHRSLIAWDFGRLIMLARWGFSLGFLSEAEAWSWIERAAGQIEASFRSWLDVGEDYLAGVRVWSKDKESLVDDTQAALDRLLHPQDARSAKSPWIRTPFPGAGAQPDVARRVEARRIARAKKHAGDVRNFVLLVAAVVIAIVGGRILGPRFHPCDRLDSRLCADLGPEACEVWKGRFGKAGSGSALPHDARGRRMLFDKGLHLLLGWDGQRSHEICSVQNDDAAYPVTLGAVRATIAVARR